MAAPVLRSVSAVAGERALALGEALGILRDAAEALGKLHAAGGVHGGVCAENLVLDEQGVTRLIRDAPTPPVLSPEQLAGRRPDARSDVYALGMTVGELLADAGPLPAPFERLLALMTAERPAERYQSMDDVLTALEACELMTGHRACRPGQQAKAAGERRGLLAAIVVVLALVVVGLALLVVLRRTPEPSGTPPDSHGELTILTEKLTPLPQPPKPTTSR